jgi:hypothetical protein
MLSLPVSKAVEMFPALPTATHSSLVVFIIQGVADKLCSHVMPRDKFCRHQSINHFAVKYLGANHVAFAFPLHSLCSGLTLVEGVTVYWPLNKHFLYEN